jgi:hypothetical protein
MDFITKVIMVYAYFISIPIAFWVANTEGARSTRRYQNLNLPHKPIPWFGWNDFREYTSVYSLICGVIGAIVPWLNWIFVLDLLGCLIWQYIFKPARNGFKYLVSKDISEIRPFKKN